MGPHHRLPTQRQAGNHLDHPLPEQAHRALRHSDQVTFEGFPA